MSALRRIDSVFAWITWAAAALVVVMLLAGPAIVAHDKSSASAGSPYSGSGASTNGKQVFVSSCGSCHTLAAAGTSGSVGPDLDHASLSESQVESQVRQGGGAMPAFAGQLSDAQIKAVSAFVASSSK